MPPAAAPVASPTTAERVHSACSNAESSVLALPGLDPVPTSVHRLRLCGDMVIAVPAESTAAMLVDRCGTTGSPAVLELTDNAPLPLREPVRALVWLRGWVHAVPSHAQRALATAVAEDHPHPNLLDVGHTSVLLRLVIDSAVVADTAGADSVSREQLRAARPDPFCGMEAAWLQHLHADHADVIDRLARHLPADIRRGALVHPLAIDRYGVTLRVEAIDRDHDIRLPFHAPADDVESLSRAVQTLAGNPFQRGLHRI
ncbi:DUF2470 domain-containing protein [Nocardia yamanashiensis]|uniref:DUF2470 domain-containing protein n=1 Tax=Nocardia yamanashiensis TaxID=209247 RepID=UPI00082D30D7|nr:DUF2470 domain-containing protein [Nocardia yamanashiensis]UGT40421.1 DUF2470 domain-containing protein [Nocardia yamanashiensis]